MAITKAILISIISFAIISYLPFFRVFLAFPEKLRVDDVSRYIRRFEAAKTMLPEHGVIGYRSDCSDMSNINCIADFYLAQYALSPIILDRSPKHNLVLGNFGNPDATQRESTGDIVKVLMDSGNGIKLYLVDSK